MSNYRRLISYIYAYEGEIKGKNIGFAKIEARNGQCKIQVNVKKVYVGSSDMGVYLLGQDTEIMLGKIFIRGGAGEFRTAVLVNNVENSGQTMDQCFGLTIHSVDDSWQSYTTIWEDAAARTAAENETETETSVTHAAQLQPVDSDAVEHTAQIDLSEITAEQREQEEMNKKPKTFIPEMTAAETRPEVRSVVEEIESEIEAQSWAEPQRQPESQCQPEPYSQPEPQCQPPIMEERTAAPIEDSAVLEQLEQEEDEENQSDRLWRHFSRTYPKIVAFDYANGCEILTIKPQDIGLLPRETWTYGNNSFLLHGYYNYRHLIIVRLNNPDGAPRYLLGVPGHYYSNEKYMATMFGFPNFVLAKMQPAGDGRFGYWYADINMGNQ